MCIVAEQIDHTTGHISRLIGQHCTCIMTISVMEDGIGSDAIRHIRLCNRLHACLESCLEHRALYRIRITDQPICMLQHNNRSSTISLHTRTHRIDNRHR